jgi:hypothetical protein
MTKCARSKWLRSDTTRRRKNAHPHGCQGQGWTSQVLARLWPFWLEGLARSAQGERLLVTRSPLSEALRKVIWVHLVRGYLFGVGLFECHVQERGAESRAPAIQVSEDTFYTQRDPTPFLTSVIKWPKSRLGAAMLPAAENYSKILSNTKFCRVFERHPGRTTAPATWNGRSVAHEVRPSRLTRPKGLAFLSFAGLTDP